MASKYTNDNNKQKTKNSIIDPINKNNDVVERFLSVLWRREVGWKLTFK
tara:strand:- start:282 stop:428 length:147 start_codon:yes stop_codon:yes gene_type:complete